MVQNFTGDGNWESWFASHLVGDEKLLVISRDENRTVIATSARLVLVEKSGEFSGIRRSQLAAVEVSANSRGGSFVKLYFGGGLSRAVGAPSEAEAWALFDALTV